MSYNKNTIHKGATEYLITCSKCGGEHVEYCMTIQQAISTFRTDCGWKLTSKESICPTCIKMKLNADKTCKDCRYYKHINHNGTPDDEIYNECTWHDEVLQNYDICDCFKSKNE